MSAVFVHISDIHFGQEKDQRVHIHNDVKKQLIADAKYVVQERLKTTAAAILVTGDIAYSGTEDQFKVAGEWLDALAKAVDCPQNQVQLIPGNHDLDRNKTSRPESPWVCKAAMSNVVGALSGAEAFEQLADCCP